MAAKGYTNYKGQFFTGDERGAMAKETMRELFMMGAPDKPYSCWACQQDRGIIYWHNEDYSVPVSDHVWAMCWRCHMVWHSRFRAPAQVKKYFAEVLDGKRFEPVFRHDFSVLARDHQIL